MNRKPPLLKLNFIILLKSRKLELFGKEICCKICAQARPSAALSLQLSEVKVSFKLASSQCRQIHFGILTNTLCYLDKYTSLSAALALQPSEVKVS